MCGRIRPGTRPGTRPGSALGLAAVILFFAGVSAAPAQKEGGFCDVAAGQCLFRFVDSVGDMAPFFDVVAARPDVAFTPRIRLHEMINQTAGIVNMNKLEPEFVNDTTGDVMPVSHFPVRGGVSPFSRTLFKPLCEVEIMMKAPDGTNYTTCFYSGIGHENFQPGQESLIENRCVRVWLTQWQLLDEETGNVIKNIEAQYDKRDRFCIVFHT